MVEVGLAQDRIGLVYDLTTMAHRVRKSLIKMGQPIQIAKIIIKTSIAKTSKETQAPILVRS